MEDEGGQAVNVVPADGSGFALKTGPSGASVSVAWAPDGTGLLDLAEGSDSPLLLDPAGCTPNPAPWTSASFPEWQRVAR